MRVRQKEVQQGTVRGQVMVQGIQEEDGMRTKRRMQGGGQMNILGYEGKVEEYGRRVYEQGSLGYVEKVEYGMGTKMRRVWRRESGVRICTMVDRGGWRKKRGYLGTISCFTIGHTCIVASQPKQLRHSYCVIASSHRYVINASWLVLFRGDCVSPNVVVMGVRGGVWGYRQL